MSRLVMEINTRNIQSNVGKYSARLSTDGVQSQHEKFRISDDFFRQLVESMQDYAVFTTDKEGNVSSWNEGAERMLGFTEEEIIGKSAAIFFVPKDRKMGIPLKELKRASTNGRAVNERWHIKKNGDRFWGSGLTFPLKDEQGKIRGFTKVMRDLTEKKEKDEQLFAYQNQFEILVKNVRDYAIFIIDENGIVKTWNKAAEKIKGYKAKDIIGKYYGILFTHEQQQKKDPQTELEVTASKGTFEEVNWRMKKNGELFWAHINLTALRDKNGKLLGFAKITQDLTEVKKRDEESARLSAIITSSNDAIISKDLDGIITTWNKAAEKIFGYKAGEAIGKHITIIIPKDRHKEEEQIISKIRSGRRVEHFDTERIKKDGTRISVSVTVSPIKDINGKIIGASKIARDITGRKKAEDELRESELRFRSLADTAPMYIAMADETGNAVYFNKPWLKYTGNKLEDMLGLGWLRTLHPQDAPKFEKDFKNAFKKQIPISEQYRFRKANGEYRWMLAVGAPRITPDGKFIGYFGTYTDFHELKEAQLAVEESEKRFRVVSDNATTGLFIMDNQQRCTFMNPAAEKMTGFTFEQVKKMNKPLHDIIHHTKPDGNHYPISECPIDKALPTKTNIPGEDIFIRPDGSFYPVAFMASAIIDKGKPVGTVIEVRDITDEKRKEEERRRLERQKDEFLGVASHELKTPVTSIKAYTQVLQLAFKRKNDMQSVELLSKMDSQITKLNTLISDLLDITKIEAGKLQFRIEDFDFNEVVSEVVEQIQRTAVHHTIVTELGKSKTIYGDRDRTGQVITNLLTNAIKYSPHASKIYVRVSAERNKITLCVQDFGVGIPKAKQDKVFERFYRVDGAKEDTYPGLGLGLYISSEIVKRQGGTIWVNSEEGNGSTFCFTLPIKKGGY